MQFVLNKLGFQKHYFGSSSVKAEPYSPFAKHIDDIQDKRSRLFPDRRRIPGRKTKYIVSIVFLIQIYAFMKVCHAKKVYSQKANQQRNLQRKSVPYFQSLQDIQYTIQKHRLQLMVEQVLGQQYMKRPLYHNELTWVPNKGDGFAWAGYGIERYAHTSSQHLGNTYLSGYNIQNI